MKVGARAGTGGRPLGRTRGRIPARLAVRVIFSGSEALALFAVLAAEHHLDGIWVPWAFGVLAALVGLDRGTAARIHPRLVDEIGPVAGRVGVAVLLVIPFLRAPANELAVVGLSALLAILVARGLAYASVREARRRGWLHHRALIVGSGEVAARIIRAALEHPEYGMRPIGLVDDDAGVATSAVARLGSLVDIEAVARRGQVSRIVVAFSSAPEVLTLRLLRACERLSVELYVVPRFFELGLDASVTDDLWGIPLALLPCALVRRTSRALKRGSDVVVSAVALTVLSPLLAIVAMAIRCTGPGPVTFRQSRVGLDGRHFTVIKFRTMVANDDGDLTWSVVHDPRVTRLGRFLRRTGLDEAPQLFNVLLGQMSLVGPRPERPVFAGIFAAAVPEYEARHRVRVGITGWAQVNGLRGDTSIADRARFDNYYVANWTLRGDIVILLRTVALLFRQMIPDRRVAAEVDLETPTPAAALTASSLPILEDFPSPLGTTSSALPAVVTQTSTG
jgi:exopolysaccharide biosynthesis polyprenyl glycosylphosphotransferase